ncbi:MAG: dipeptide/oligopeptide/nickel ABC transporter ATP-binding protein [Bacillota bacterium]
MFFKQKKKILSEISFCLKDGETMGIVGKSGSGKSTIAHAILRLMKYSSGAILLDGNSISAALSQLELAQKIQLVTQNPETSFDPDLSIRKSLTEVLHTHKLINGKDDFQRIVKPLLRDVNLEDADLSKYPGRFSGGELQRLSIVRALLVKPKILILDEADSMLDTSIRLRFFATLKNLRSKYSLSYIYITHDIRVLPELVDFVVILSAGKIVESGNVAILKSSNVGFIKEIRDNLEVEITNEE